MGHSSCPVEVNGKKSEPVATFVSKFFLGWYVNSNNRLTGKDSKSFKYKVPRNAVTSFILTRFGF